MGRTCSMCGFEIAAYKPPYKGVRGEGAVHILNETGAYVLDLLMKKYLGEKESTLSKLLRDNSKTEVAIEITPQKKYFIMTILKEWRVHDNMMMDALPAAQKTLEIGRCGKIKTKPRHGKSSATTAKSSSIHNLRISQSGIIY